VAGGDRSFLEVSEAEAAAIAEQSKSAGADALTRIMEVLSDGEGRLKDASSKKILIEITLLKAIQARQSVSVDSLLTKLRELQSTNGGASGPANAAQPTPAAKPASASPPPRPAAPVARVESGDTNPIPPRAPQPEQVAAKTSKANPASTSPEPSNIDLTQLWRDVIEAASRASSFAKAYLIKTHPVSFTKGTLVLGLDPEFQDEFSMLDTPKNRTLVQTKLGEMGIQNATARFLVASAPEGWAKPSSETLPPQEAAPSPAARAPIATAKAAPAPEPARPAPVQLNKDDFKNDPLIKRALEIFKGQIVEVRA
jgi:DNA polymerase-3 subunit gamma/tau